MMQETIELQEVMGKEMATYKNYRHTVCSGKLRITGLGNLMCKTCNKLIRNRKEVSLVWQ